MQNVSAEAKDLIKKILVPADNRLTLEQIYKHPWMTEKVNTQPLKINFKMMKDFGKSSKLKKLAGTYIASQLS
jgi:calcium-dependent protein kinase